MITFMTWVWFFLVLVVIYPQVIRSFSNPTSDSESATFHMKHKFTDFFFYSQWESSELRLSDSIIIPKNSIVIWNLNRITQERPLISTFQRCYIGICEICNLKCIKSGGILGRYWQPRPTWVWKVNNSWNCFASRQSYLDVFNGIPRTCTSWLAIEKKKKKNKLRFLSSSLSLSSWNIWKCKFPKCKSIPEIWVFTYFV